MEDRKIFLMREWGWFEWSYLAIVVMSLFLRLFALGEGPFHHDEGLYATYAYKFFQGEGYAYAPMMHGPFLFHWTTFLFFLFGDSNFVARLASSLFGVLLVLLPYGIRQHLGKKGALVAALLFSLSPSYLYFSRFLRHDIFSVVFTLMLVLFWIRFWETRKEGFLYVAFISLSLLFCVKENAYLHLFIFILFGFWKRFMKGFVKEQELDEERGSTAFTSFKELIQTKWREILIGLFLSIGVYLLFYTTFLTNPSGFLDGIYRKSLSYWWNQHQIRRIQGPFHYYIPLLLLYELPVLLTVIGGGIQNSRSRFFQKIFLPLFSLFSFGLWVFWNQPLPDWLTWTHLDSTRGLVLGSFIGITGFSLVLLLERRRKTFHSFLIFWVTMSFLAYSFVGEKVPWLLIHPLLPMVLFASLQVDPLLKWVKGRRGRKTLVSFVMVGVLLLVLHSSLLLSFAHRANPVERMVYTQTSPDILKIIKSVEKVSFEIGLDPEALPMAVQGSAVWPLSWYFRHYKYWYHPDPIRSPRFAILIMDWKEAEKKRAFLETHYRVTRFRLRSWWVPDLKKANVKKFLRYYFYREPFSPLGSTDIAYCVLKNLRWLPEARTFDQRIKLLERKEGRKGVSGPLFVLPVEVWGDEALFGQVKDLALGPDRSLYAMDMERSQITRFSPEGAILVQWGSSGSGNGEFEKPVGLGVDSNGDVYVADTWNHRIQKFSSDGAWLSSIEGKDHSFWAPKDVVFDDQDNLYVADTGRHQIQKFSNRGKKLRVIGSKGDKKGDLREPVGLEIDSEGNLFVADTGNRRIQQFHLGRKGISSFNVLGWERLETEPYLSFDDKGRLFVTDSYHDRILIYSKTGLILRIWGRKGSELGEFHRPIGICFDSTRSRIYVADSFNHRIQVFELKDLQLP